MEGHILVHANKSRLKVIIKKKGGKQETSNIKPLKKEECKVAAIKMNTNKVV